MQFRTYLRLFFLILIVSISLTLYSYMKSTPQNVSGEDSGKCDQKKGQTEFILWESLSHNLLSFNK